MWWYATERDAFRGRVADTKYGSMWGVGVLIMYRGLMGFAFGRVSRRGVICLIILSTLRWVMALLLNSAMILGEGGFL